MEITRAIRNVSLFVLYSCPLFTCREKTPDDRLTPVAEGAWDWLDSDDEVESDLETCEQTNLDHLTLAERIAMKRKTEQSSEVGEYSDGSDGIDPV